MRGSGADGVRLICSVNAEAEFIESAPDDTDGVVGAWGHHFEVVGAHSSVQYALVPSVGWEEADSGDAPFAFWGWEAWGTDCDGESGEGF